jgi:hypothetical protein
MVVEGKQTITTNPTGLCQIRGNLIPRTDPLVIDTVDFLQSISTSPDETMSSGEHPSGGNKS